MMESVGKIYNKVAKKDYKVIDTAWDEFSDYIGENKLNTPLNLKQFEDLFHKLNKEGKYSGMKYFILESFRYDSYLWPLVEREK